MTKSKIIYSTFVFVFITFLQPSLSFFLLPIYLEYFPVSDYGIYILLNTITNFIGIIAAARISSAVYTYYYDFAHSEKKTNEYIGNIMGFTLLSGILLFTLIYILGDYIFSLLFSDQGILFSPLGIYSIVSGIAMSIVLPYNILLRNKKEVFRFAFVQLFLVISTVIFQLTLVIGFKRGIEGALLGRMVATLLTAFVVLILVARQITFKFNKAYILKSLKFSIPLIPFSIVSWLSLYGDRFVIEQYYSLETVGVYGLLTAICMLIIMGNEAVIGGIQPYLFEYFAIDNQKKKINAIYRYYIAIMLLTTSFIILVGTNIHLITDKSGFLEIIQYLSPAALVYFISSYYNLFKAKLMFQKKTRLISSLYVIVTAITFVSYFLLIPPFGIWGAILSNLFGFLSISLLFFVFSYRNEYNTIELIDILVFPLVCCMIMILGFMSARLGFMSFQSSGWLQFVVILLALGVNFKYEINEIFKLVQIKIKN